jgi:hypothetical protein
MSTTSKKERTSKGVGVGSTEASVKKNVPKVKCVTEFGTRHCHVGEFLAGKVVTDFFISKKHRVKRVVIGRVID